MIDRKNGEKVSEESVLSIHLDDDNDYNICCSFNGHKHEVLRLHQIRSWSKFALLFNLRKHGEIYDPISLN